MFFKKTLSVLLTLTLCLCLFAGCGNDQPGTSVENGEEAPPTVGMVVFNAGAAMEICYNAEGLVYSVAGVDENGIIISDRLSNYIDQPCASVVKKLADLCIEAGFLTEETPAIIVKQTIGSILPNEDFFHEVTIDLRGLLENVPVIIIPETSLNENGLINFEAAKDLVANYLKLEDASNITGDSTPVQGLYAMSLPSSLRVLLYTVDAHTGTVTEGYPGGEAGDNILEIDPGGAMYDPNNPELFPDETHPTEEATEPGSFDEDPLSPDELTGSEDYQAPEDTQPSDEPLDSQESLGTEATVTP